jgi:hypothetical protein
MKYACPVRREGQSPPLSLPLLGWKLVPSAFTGFELAIEDDGGIGEFLLWQAELGAKEDLGWPPPGESQHHQTWTLQIGSREDRARKAV